MMTAGCYEVFIPNIKYGSQFDIRGSAHHSTIHKEKPKKMQQ
jgi:hypothetical protein